MSENKWVRSISFNRTNPRDLERLKLIGKKSFSRYIKKLLDEEIKRQTKQPQQPKEIQISGPTKLTLKANPMLGGVKNDNRNSIRS